MIIITAVYLIAALGVYEPSSHELQRLRQDAHNIIQGNSEQGEFYRKIHCLMREFRVKLHAKTYIGFQAQFNAEFKSQVMDFL